MPSLDPFFLFDLKDDYKRYTCFVETGTYYGETIFTLESWFNTIYTIEFSEKYYNDTKNRYNGNKINFMLGDSSVVFETLLPTISENTIFFLDGHWSSGDTGKSAKDCPLYEEITHIYNLFRHEAILIVDDYRMFGSKEGNMGPNWQDINKRALLNILKSRITNVYHLDSTSAKDDRLIIHICAK